MTNAISPTVRKGASCRLCGEAVEGTASRKDVAEGLYCLSCYQSLRNAASTTSANPLFRCTICGQTAPAGKLSEFDGRIVCKDCTAQGDAQTEAAAEDSAAPTAAEAAANDVLQCLSDPLPKNVLSKLTCPHCWHTFGPEQVLWISQHAELIGDPVLGPEAPLRFRPSRFNAKGEALDGRDMPCQILACPRCHLNVPRAIVETQPLFISIVGAPASGKSHFLAAMCWELRRLLPARFGVAFNDADTLTNHALNTYEETLFLQSDTNRLVAIRKTELQGELYDQIRLGQQVILLPRPFLFTLRPSGGNGAVRLMCLYDNAGEHFHPGMDSTASPGTQHLARSRVILFLFDPTQHPRFREACQPASTDPQLFDAARNQRQEIVLTEAAARVRRYAGLSPQQRHTQPLLVIVSKADAWASLLDVDLKQEPLSNSPSDAKSCGLDIVEIERVSARVRNLLMRFTPEFVTAAEDFCHHVLYIPISALGHAPELEAQTGMLGVRPRDVQPHWVTVPILYALAKWTKGLVPALASAPSGSQKPMNE